MTNENAPVRPVVRSGLNDIATALAGAESWGSLGLFDIRQRYRRSSIGPLWIVLSTAAVAGGIGFMMSNIQGRPLTNLIGYIVTGIMIWQFISTTLVESCSALIIRATYIRSFNQPISTHIFRAIWVQSLIFFHTLLLYPLIVFFAGVDMNWNLLFIFPGFFLLLINVSWLGVVLSVLSARFRDIPLLVGNFLSFFMFLTPVFWEPGDEHHNFALIDWNPFYWLIQLVREPMLGHMPSTAYWLYSVGLAVAGWALAVALFNGKYRRLALWV